MIISLFFLRSFTKSATYYLLHLYNLLRLTYLRLVESAEQILYTREMSHIGDICNKYMLQ